MDHFTIKSV